MHIDYIRTQRKYQKWPSFDLVYEWEDMISKLLDIPLKEESYLYMRCNRLLKKLNINTSLLPFNKNYSLVFDMRAKTGSDLYNNKYVIPVIIDFYILKEELKKFYAAYSKVPFILVSSAEVIQFLKENHCPLKYYHFPLSISDKYRITANVNFEKKYDLALMGRQNPVLENFLQQYLKNYPQTTYIYRKLEKGRFLYYNNQEEFIGNIKEREQFISLMRQCKIGFYSTPGMDGGEIRTKGFNQVTPRFLELIASGCHVIARYKTNPDTDFYELSKFSPDIDTYEDFEKQMNIAMNKNIDYREYANYLENFYTSERVKTIKLFCKD
jgi:hypothetical protein